MFVGLTEEFGRGAAWDDRTDEEVGEVTAVVAGVTRLTTSEGNVAGVLFLTGEGRDCDCVGGSAVVGGNEAVPCADDICPRVGGVIVGEVEG
jgi:hypothetical protein